MRIRPARPADAPGVSGLLNQLGYPQDDPSALKDRLRAWDDDPASAVFVAMVGTDLLGVVAVHVCPYFERTGSWARITAIVVDDRARGRGLGGALVAAAETFATARGCLCTEVTSADHRRDAHGFYRRHGYVDQAGTSSRFLRHLPAKSVGPGSSG